MRRLLLAAAAACLPAAAAPPAPPAPPCRAPWGNERALESPCFSALVAAGDVSVRRYAPRGAGYAQAFVEAASAGAANATAYPARLDAAVAAQLRYFSGDNSARAAVARTAPILARANATRRAVFDWMLPTTAYARAARAPAPAPALGLRLVASTLGAGGPVAALHFTVSGVPSQGDFDQACDTLLPLLPGMGYRAVAGEWSPTYAYYTSRDFDGQHDGECLIEVAAV